MDFFTKLQQLISQLQGVTPENFNYWECFGLILKVIGLIIGYAVIYVAIAIAVIGLIIFSIAKLPGILFKISAADRTIKEISYDTHLGMCFTYERGKWEEYLKKQKKAKHSIIVIFSVVAILLISPIYFSPEASFWGWVTLLIGIGVAVYATYFWDPLDTITKNEKEIYEKRVYDLLWGRAYQNASPQEKESKTAMHTIIVADFKEHRSDFAYNVIMKERDKRDKRDREGGNIIWTFLTY
jgi:hypothetical protein